MFSDQYFLKDSHKKKSSRNARALYKEPTDIARAHARGDFFSKPKESFGALVLSTPAEKTPEPNENPLPPPIPCLICQCPAIWSTIYEPHNWLCCDCDPPPGGKDGVDAWHWQRGGWAFVGHRLMLWAVSDRELIWCPFPKVDPAYLKRLDIDVVIIQALPELGSALTIAQPIALADK